MTSQQDKQRPPPRPMLRYHGGKWKIADWIIGHFPAHRVYVEPFGGGASVLLRKPRSYAEVYNDLEGEIVNVFRVARDHGPILKELLRLPPFARDEFLLAYESSPCPIETARRTIIRSFMGHGANGVLSKKGRTGFRANSNKSGTTPAHDWRNYADVFDFLVDRLRGTVLENRDAMEVMAQQDSPDALHYVDPPYVLSTRDDTGHGYRHEMTDEQHVALAAFLKGLQGGVIISGYASELYCDLFAKWRRVDKPTFKDGGIASTESIWISPNTGGRKGSLI
jgi:DNA adenine methylase